MARRRHAHCHVETPFNVARRTCPSATKICAMRRGNIVVVVLILPFLTRGDGEEVSTSRCVVFLFWHDEEVFTSLLGGSSHFRHGEEVDSSPLCRFSVFGCTFIILLSIIYFVTNAHRGILYPWVRTKPLLQPVKNPYPWCGYEFSGAGVQSIRLLPR
jgi:hypothetical protein